MAMSPLAIPPLVDSNPSYKYYKFKLKGCKTQGNKIHLTAIVVSKLKPTILSYNWIKLQLIYSLFSQATGQVKLRKLQ